MRVPFVKMHGAGNDFVMIDDRAGSFPEDPRLIAEIAPRGVGIGCEGVVLVQESARADFKMRFFNPDGSEAAMCGNGARCVAAFAREIGAARADRMRFEIGSIYLKAEQPEKALEWFTSSIENRERYADSLGGAAVASVQVLPFAGSPSAPSAGGRLSSSVADPRLSRSTSSSPSSPALVAGWETASCSPPKLSCPCSGE